jgi:type II secretory pathway pseudopilin PulG
MQPTPLPQGRLTERSGPDAATVPVIDSQRATAAATPATPGRQAMAPEDVDPSMDVDRHGSPAASEPFESPDPVVAWWRRPGWALVVVSVVILAAVAVLVGWGLHTRAQAAATTRTTESVQRQVHRTLEQLRTTQGQLSTVTAQEQSANATLSTDTALLKTQQAELSQDQSTISAQGVNISKLQACLTGIQETLNEISLGDTAHAVASLQAVAPDCTAAEPAG